MQATDRIEITPGVCGGKPRIAGTRIRVQDIVVWHEINGEGPDSIVAAHPHLTLGDVHSALAYYFEHVDEINRHIREGEALVEVIKSQHHSTPAQPAAGTDADGDSLSS